MTSTDNAKTAVESKGLKGGALGLVSSVVVGMASTAPAYSLAASLGLVVASGGALLAGVKAPAIVLISFIPLVGWMGGWGIIAAGVIWIVVMTYICYRGIEVSARV